MTESNLETIPQKIGEDLLAGGVDDILRIIMAAFYWIHPTGDRTGFDPQ